MQKVWVHENEKIEKVQKKYSDLKTEKLGIVKWKRFGFLKVKMMGYTKWKVCGS